MTGTPNQEQWAAVRALWFALQELPPSEREAELAAATVPPGVRAEVRGLLAAEASIGDRFEAGAADLLQDAPPAPMPSLVGRRLGAYDVVRRIGQGGMGAVYEARRADDAFTQRVAIKTIWRGADSDVLLRRFRSERQILAGLQHPNIAALLDGGTTDDGTPWLAMEFVDGEPIDVHCDRRGLDLAARLDLFRQACAAVHFAHRHLVVHRDLKPSNVLVTHDGTVKLLDFGIAKLLDDPRHEGTLTGAGLSPFTAQYAAPEQLLGQRVSIATDVYSLGVLLSVLLSGRPPLDLGDVTLVELITAAREVTPRAPSQLARGESLAGGAGEDAAAARVRGFASPDRLARALEGELDAIALMALRKAPERRYESADALASDVLRYLRRERVLARPDSPMYRVATFVRRRRVPVVAGALALAVVAGAAGVVSWQERRAAAERLRATQRLGEVRTLASALVYDANDRLVDVPGATETRLALVRTALTALDRASADAPRDSVLLRELALAYVRAGDVLGNPTQASGGDLPRAADAYRKAIELAESLMRWRPDDRASAWTLALVYEKAADVEAPLGRMPAALAHQRASLALFRRIAAQDTTRYAAIAAVAVSALKTGDLLGHPAFTNAGDTSAAIAAYREAVTQLERARVHGDTTFATRRHRAVARERLGRLMQERGDLAAATHWLAESLELRDSLVLEAPRSVQARRDVAIGRYLLCGLHLATGQADLALEQCERSLEIRRALLAEDARNPVLLRGMGIIHGRLGDVHARRGDSAVALRELERAIDFYGRFFEGRTIAINDRRDLAQILLQHAQIAGARPGAASVRASTASYRAVIAAVDSIRAAAPLMARDSGLLAAATRDLAATTARSPWRRRLRRLDAAGGTRPGSTSIVDVEPGLVHATVAPRRVSSWRRRTRCRSPSRRGDPAGSRSPSARSRC